MLATTFHERGKPNEDWAKIHWKKMKHEPYPDYLNSDGDQRNKTHYASAYDRELRVHLWEHMRKKGPWKPPETIDSMIEQEMHKTTNSQSAEKGDPATFVHLFGSPLFKVVAANWARLIVRRSFDLDLLEWRPASLAHCDTVEEIKSRRVAIGSHYRDIDASVEVLSGLTQEERPMIVLRKYQNSLHEDIKSVLQLALFDTNPQWNRGRSNGFVQGEADEDSWQKVYYDYFELRASIEALSKRADKIQEGIIGLIEVWGGQQSKNLTRIALMFSVLIIPFTIAGTVFGANLTRQPADGDDGFLPPKDWKRFTGAVGGTMAVLVLGWILYHYVVEKSSDSLKLWSRRLGTKIGVRTNSLLKFCPKLKKKKNGTAATVRDGNSKAEMASGASTNASNRVQERQKASPSLV
jgi:Mg2+ and Co2+ transporter CorA